MRLSPIPAHERRESHLSSARFVGRRAQVPHQWQFELLSISRTCWLAANGARAGLLAQRYSCSMLQLC